MLQLNKNTKKESKLYHAVVQGDLPLVNFLLNSIFLKSNTSALLTAFHFALNNNQIAIAKRLLVEENLYNYVSEKRESFKLYEDFFNLHMQLVDSCLANRLGSSPSGPT